MDNGQIIDIGTHIDLYKNMFNWYMNNKNDMEEAYE